MPLPNRMDQQLGSALSDSLGAFVQKKLNKLQQRDLLSLLSQQQQPGSNMLNDAIGQGLQGGNMPQGLSLRDLLEGRTENAIERSVGRTPVKFPMMGQQRQAPMAQAPQLTQMQKQQLPVPVEPDYSYETSAQRSRRELEQLKHKNRKELEEIKRKEAKQGRIDKETLPYYKKIKDQYATSAEVDARLDEMEDLINTGNVQEGALLKGFEALSHVPYVGPFAGAIQQAFLTNESQVFKKLSTDFLRDAKPYFGNNLSTREVELFLERVPSLMLTNEGNKAVIRNFRALNDYVKSIDKIMEGVIAENGGERPRDLQARVQERMKAPSENLRKAFRDSAKLIPKKKPSQSFTKQAYEKSKKRLL